MIPLTTLCDNYIDWPKLTEQKNPFEYIVPPLLKWVGTIIQTKHNEIMFGLDNSTFV